MLDFGRTVWKQWRHIRMIKLHPIYNIHTHITHNTRYDATSGHMQLLWVYQQPSTNVHILKSGHNLWHLSVTKLDVAVNDWRYIPQLEAMCPIWSLTQQHTTTTVLRPFVQDYAGEPVPEETLTHPPSWPSSNLYKLLPSTTIHSILPVQITCLAIFLHNLSPCPLWSTWSGALHLIFHTFLHPISVLFSQHMPIQLPSHSQPVLL